jgi:hypothetical protein
MKICKGVEVYLLLFLTSAVDGDEWSASLSGLFKEWNPLRGRLVGL